MQRSIFYVNHKKRQTDRQHRKLLYSFLDVFLRIYDDEMGFVRGMESVVVGVFTFVSSFQAKYFKG